MKPRWHETCRKQFLQLPEGCLAAITASGGLGRDQRQANAKVRAPFGAVRSSDQTIVRNDHLLDDRETQASPVRLRGRERLKQLT